MIDQPIADFMNPDVLHGDEQTSLLEVVSQMNAESQSAFVVCDGSVPVGVITERDAVRILERSLSGTRFEETRACDVMATPLHTLSASACMGDVFQILKERGFRRVPIVDSKNELIGIINLMDLQDAMNTALERRGRDLEVAVMARTAELLTANAKLEELSLRDSLTGLLNRRAMAAKLGELHSLYQRYGNPYSVILLDIDHFKLLNDTRGHLWGDAVLEQISAALAESVRVSDSIYRYGGEEFLAALPETTGEDAKLVAERIRTKIVELQIPHPQSETADVVTVSLGFAQVHSGEVASKGTWEQLVERADRALYRAKQTGRNRVVQDSETE